MHQDLVSDTSYTTTLPHCSNISLEHLKHCPKTQRPFGF